MRGTLRLHYYRWRDERNIRLGIISKHRRYVPPHSMKPCNPINQSRGLSCNLASSVIAWGRSDSIQFSSDGSSPPALVIMTILISHYYLYFSLLVCCADNVARFLPWNFPTIVNEWLHFTLCSIICTTHSTKNHTDGLRHRRRWWRRKIHQSSIIAALGCLPIYAARVSLVGINYNPLSIENRNQTHHQWNWKYTVCIAYSSRFIMLSLVNFHLCIYP